MIKQSEVVELCEFVDPRNGRYIVPGCEDTLNFLKIHRIEDETLVIVKKNIEILRSQVLELPEYSRFKKQ